MGIKKKHEANIGKLKVDLCLEQKLKDLFESTHDESLGNLLLLLDSSDTFQQISFVKKIGCQLEIITHEPSEVAALAVTILVKTYFQVDAKSALRKTLCRVLCRACPNKQIVVVGALVKELDSIIQNIDISQKKKSVESILACLDNFPLGTKAVAISHLKVCEFLQKELLVLIQESRDLKSPQETTEEFAALQNVLKALTILFQQCKSEICQNLHHQKNDTLNHLLKKILESTKLCLANDAAVFTCKINAGILFCVTVQILEMKLVMIDEPRIQPQKVTFPIVSLYELPLSSQLCLWSGALATLSIEELANPCPQQNSLLVDCILPHILKLASSADDHVLSLACSKVLLQWTEVCCQATHMKSMEHQLSEDSTAFSLLLQYVWNNWEHYVDAVRHHVRNIFNNVLKIHLANSSGDSKETSFMKNIIQLVLEMPSHRCSRYGMLSSLASYLGCSVVLGYHPTLAHDLFDALTENTLVSHVAELITVLCREYIHECEPSVWEQTWLHPLLNTLKCGTQSQTSAIIHSVLPCMLKIHPEGIYFLTSQLSTDLSDNLPILITCVKAAQVIPGIVRNNLSGDEKLKTCLTDEVMRKALCHEDDEVRLSAFSFICCSFQTIGVLTDKEFSLIKYSLVWNLKSQSPSFRQQFISQIKKFLCRVRDSKNALLRRVEQKEAESISSLETYKSFLDWIKDFLFSCLYPGANFPHRVTTLQLLSLLHSILSQKLNEKPGLSINIFKSKPHCQTLLECLKDTYENNKQIVLKLLADCPSEMLGFENKSRVEQCLETILTYSSSSKPPDSITAAYLSSALVRHSIVQGSAMEMCEHLQKHCSLYVNLKLLKKVTVRNTCYTVLQTLMLHLNHQMDIAQHSLLDAAAHGPMYGALTCIRLVLAEADLRCLEGSDEVQCWQELLSSLINLCFYVARLVEPVVCNSSPEGHLPMDTNPDSITQLQTLVQNSIGHRFEDAIVSADSNEEKKKSFVVVDLVKTRAVTAQMLLLCSWRTHKEVSLLLGEICSQATIVNPAATNDSGLLSYEQILEMGSFFTHQLAEVKHRGAFEQAYIGFCKLCQLLWRCTISSLHQLPSKWLQELLAVIKGELTAFKLCPTRRSAGVPFMVQALLTSEPMVTGSTCFKDAMTELLKMAISVQNCDQQIHSQNVLRALFKDSCLGEKVMPYVAEGVKAAIQGFKDLSWAVRNSATLLFTSLMTRIFGVNRSRGEPQKKNCMTGRIFFLRFPSLFDFLLSELKESLQYDGQKGSDLFQPSLYPILLLFARLYPSVIEGNDSTLKLDVFVPYVHSCAKSAVWKIRLLAARALTSLTTTSSYLPLLKNLFSALSDCTTKGRFCQNYIHGILLQIFHLLKEVLKLPNDLKDEVKHQLPVWIGHYSAIMSRHNPCFSTRTLYVEIIEYAVKNGFIEFGDIAAEKFVTDLKDEVQLGLRIPGRELYLSSATKLGIHLVMLKIGSVENDLTGISHFIQTALASVVHEVRLTALYFIRHLLIVESSLWQVDTTYDFVLDNNSEWEGFSVSPETLSSVKSLLESETLTKLVVKIAFQEENHPLCLIEVYRLMYLLPYTWTCPWQGKDGSLNSLSQKLDCLLKKMEDTSQNDVYTSMLLFSCRLANLLYHELFEKLPISKDDEVDYAVLCRWLKIVENSALPEESIAQRMACVQVISVSSNTLFWDHHLVLGKEAIILWKTLVILLQDDEPEIKQHSGRVVCQLLSVSKSGDNEHLFPLVPTLALDLIIQLFVSHFANTFPAHCLATFLDWMLSSDRRDFSVEGDEQPFDKGEMNVFAEELMLMQLAAKHLNQLTIKEKISSLHFPRRLIQAFIEGPENALNANNELLTVNDVITTVLKEAESLSKMITHSDSDTPFQCQHYDTILLKLFQRVTVAKCLLPCLSNATEFYCTLNDIQMNLNQIKYPNLFVIRIANELSCNGVKY